MSAMIGLEVHEKEVHYIFAFYLNGLYDALNRHYRCPKKVRQLIDLGDIIELHGSINETQKFACGENYSIYNNGGEGFLKNSGYYVRLVFKNGTWYVCENARKGSKLLSEYLRKD
jgi:hypothetical protein